MSPLRVVHLDSGLSWRGGQRQALLLAIGLRERGHESFLIASPETPLAARARAAGLAVATIPMRADWDVQAAKKIRARIRAWRADIVHAHDARSHALAMIALLGRREIPLVVTRRVPFTPRSVRIKYGDRITRFIAISEAVKTAMTNGGIDPARVDVVFSGITLPSSSIEPRDWRSELGWPDDSVILGVVGAMTAEKGTDILEVVARELPPTAARSARFLLLGGEKSGLGEIGGIPAHRPGFVEDIIPAVAGIDILLHPSKAEGLGTAVLDAMALGIPAVAFGVGGIPEVIDDGADGLIIRPGDVAGFAAATGRVIADRQLRKELGESARMKAKSFDAREMTKGTEAVYNRVLQG